MKGVATFTKNEELRRSWWGRMRFQTFWSVVAQWYRRLSSDGVETGFFPLFEGSTVAEAAERLQNHVNATQPGVFIWQDSPRIGRVSFEVVPL
jgi:hypothetical protein